MHPLLRTGTPEKSQLSLILRSSVEPTPFRGLYTEVNFFLSCRANYFLLMVKEVDWRKIVVMQDREENILPLQNFPEDEELTKHFLANLRKYENARS